MGFHEGILVAQLPWSRLLPLLERHADAFSELGPIVDLRTSYPEDRDDGYKLIVAELDGRTFVGDSSFLLSGPDLVLDIARASGSLVVGCGAETAGSTFWFTAARGDDLMRLYWIDPNMETPYQRGAPLSTEALHPFVAPDGSGFFRALELLGFDGLDADGWYSRAPKRAVLWTAERTPESGPVQREIDSR